MWNVFTNSIITIYDTIILVGTSKATDRSFSFSFCKQTVPFPFRLVFRVFFEDIEKDYKIQIKIKIKCFFLCKNIYDNIMLSLSVLFFNCISILLILDILRIFEP